MDESTKGNGGEAMGEGGRWSLKEATGRRFGLKNLLLTADGKKKTVKHTATSECSAPHEPAAVRS